MVLDPDAYIGPGAVAGLNWSHLFADGAAS
jgi:hypothetical protein